mgnify:CR=1 FL=1
MPKIITEDMIEQAAIKALQERHNYTVLNCMTERKGKPGQKSHPRELYQFGVFYCRSL